MGRSYCLAGVVPERGAYRVVRPLPIRYRAAPLSGASNVGWSPFLMEGRSRWEIFELVGPEAALAEAPHLEDMWVRSLRPRRKLATPMERRAILEGTLARDGEPLFGTPLTLTHACAHLAPGAGARSLVTVKVPSAKVAFAGSWRAGALEPDIRVRLPLPEVGERHLAVKDHHLLQLARQKGNGLDEQLQALGAVVRAMGDVVAVRVGLSRAFPSRPGEPGACWLMADGFFSLAEPQP
jgi:hypothetical protein